jgi:hypothetical protein
VVAGHVLRASGMNPQKEPSEGVYRLIFKKHKNTKTYLSRPKIPEKY